MWEVSLKTGSGSVSVSLRSRCQRPFCNTQDSLVVVHRRRISCVGLVASAVVCHVIITFNVWWLVRPFLWSVVAETAAMIVKWDTVTSRCDLFWGALAYCRSIFLETKGKTTKPCQNRRRIPSGRLSNTQSARPRRANVKRRTVIGSDEMEVYHELWVGRIVKYCRPFRMLVKLKGFLVHAMVKGKVVLVYALIACRRNRGTAPLILNRCGTWKWVVSFTFRLLYPRGKSPLYSLKRLGGVVQGVPVRLRNVKSTAHPDILF